MSTLAHEGLRRRFLNSNWAVVAWMAFFALAVATAVAATPESFRQIVDNVDPSLSAADVESMKRSLEQVGLSTRFLALVETGFLIISFVGSGVLGWLLVRSTPRNAFAYLLAYSFAAQSAAIYPPSIDDVFPDRPIWALTVRLLTVFGISMLFTTAFLFPTGRFVPRWTAGGAVYAVFGVASLAFFPDAWSDSTISGVVDPVSTVVFVIAIVYSVIYRYRRVSSFEQRQQTKWVVLGLFIGLPGFFAGDAMMRNIGPGVGGVLCLLGFVFLMPIFNLAIPVSIAIAVLRRGLFEIDLLLNRTLVWLSLTALVVALYIGIVLGFGSLVGSDRNLVLSLLATGIVAVAFQPVRERVQQAANRLLYGERDDPYRVLTRLGQRIEASISYDDLLPSIVRTAAEALRLPYAALFLQHADGLRLAAVAGAEVAGAYDLPLHYQGRPIGTLIVAPRGPGEQFGSADRQLLENLARQVSIAAHAVLLTAELQRSRERIVTAREEERRRLRRDLHDGLGSQLAALAIQTSAIRSLIVRDPAQADAAVIEIRDELKSAISDIRRLVHGLRPPAIDELGLVGALAQRAQRFAAGDFDGTPSRTAVVVSAPDDLPPLPAAVEVAIFRIVEEALTNVVRHAGASRVDVEIAVDRRALRLSVTDDGIGMPSGREAGVGMSSMRERAEELGGILHASNVDHHGFRVLATFPIFTTEEATPHE
jgi:signal transduction histidine kinase